MDWFKIGKGVHQGCILSPYLFNLYAEYIMQNAGLDEAQAGIKISRRNINNIQIFRWHHPYGRKGRGSIEPLDEGKTAECKSWLKTQHSKKEIMASSPITPWQIHGDKIETLTEFIFLGFNIIADSDCSHEIERHLLLGRKSRDITLLTDVYRVEAVFFPAIMYRCKNGAIKKAECEGIDAFKLWC